MDRPPTVTGYTKFLGARSPAAPGARVLGRIDSARFFQRSQDYREHVRIWLRANGIDPAEVMCSSDVLVLALDAPTIQYAAVERRDENEPSVRLPAAGVVVTHALMAVPLPGHLNDHHEEPA